MNILHTYLNHYGYRIPRNKESAAPLLTFFLADAVQTIYTLHIEPLKFKNHLKLYSTRMMASWHKHNQLLFSSLTKSQQTAIITRMDNFQEFIEENIQELKKAVQEALYEFPKSTQEIASYLVVIVHLAGCAHISWRDIYQGVPNTYVSSLASNAGNLFKAYTRANAHTKKSIEACCRYIVGEAHAQAKDGAAVLSDEVVYGMAVHYYDEEDIVIRKAPRTEVAKKLSAKDKERLRKEAENDYKAAELRKIENREYERRKKKTELRKQEESLFTGSLF